MQQQPHFSHQPQAAYRPRKYAFLKLVGAWGIAIIVAIGIQAFAFQSYKVFGQSMEPTLQDGDYLIISKFGPTWSHVSRSDYVPERGEIIVIEPHDNPRLIKRVVGLPGERVVIRDGELRIFNGEHPEGFNPYQEFDVSSDNIAGNTTVEIPDNHIFLVGDNLTSGGSSDSRNQLGTVSTDDVVGSLTLRLWPPDNLDSF